MIWLHTHTHTHTYIHTHSFFKWTFFSVMIYHRIFYFNWRIIVLQWCFFPGPSSLSLVFEHFLCSSCHNISIRSVCVSEHMYVRVHVCAGLSDTRTTLPPLIPKMPSASCPPGTHRGCLFPLHFVEHQFQLPKGVKHFSVMSESHPSFWWLGSFSHI